MPQVQKKLKGHSAGLGFLHILLHNLQTQYAHRFPKTMIKIIPETPTKLYFLKTETFLIVN